MSVYPDTVLLGVTKLAQIYFKKYSAFELRDRNQNSDKWVQPRIEFCVVPIFAIFEYSVFEISIGILDIFFGPARARGSQLGSRRAARRGRVRARYAGSRVWQALVLASAPRGRLASSGDRGSISVVLRIILNNYNRQVGARRRLEKIQFCETQGYSTAVCLAATQLFSILYGRVCTAV